MTGKGDTPVEGKRKRGAGKLRAGRAAPAALAACLCALAVALLAWGPWAQPAPGGGGEPAGGGAASAGSEDPGGEGGGMTEEEYDAAMSIVREQLARQSIGEADVPAAFEEALAANPDVCAWLLVPGTNVTLPVCRHAADDGYYALHDASGGSSPVGAAYVEKANSPGFDDPVTVVFGHTYGDIEEQIAFAQLHYFLVGDFFSGHDSFSVLLPDGASLEYRVVSALVFNDAPILSSSGYFEDPEVLRAYFGFVSSGGGLEGQVREGAPLDAASDRIVQLETCELSADGTARLVVTGVLAGEGSWR